jgi:DNA-binding transcriptional regulator YiaG
MAARAESAPLDEAAREAAREREAAIRAIGLDGIVLGGATIRRLRRAAGLSSDELAGRIGYSGALVRAWEAGRRNCPAYLYLPLVEAISTVRRDQAVLGARVTHMCFVAGHSAA